ncbi:MAG TPA: FecR domain-containing protein [Steroidobacter sp.]|uniref:FecR family protein n=1 Tax=Steroidobacter sp. TaxID=1978227 RepID=UPI002EDA5C45
MSQEAAYWLIRWTDDAGKMPPEDQQEFNLWIRQSPENIAEFLRALEMNSAFSGKKLRDQITKVDSNVIHGDFGNGVFQYDYQPCASVSDEVPRKRKPATVRKWVARAAMLVMGASLVFTLADRTPEGVVETAASHLQQLNIEDGSGIQMDARTRLKVEMKPEERIIHLYTGQAVFDVISNRRRPFIVRTSLVDVTAVGTRFAVKVDEIGVTATVQEGVVEVTPRDRGDGQAVRLYPGEQLHIPKTRVQQFSEQRKEPVDVKRELEWTTGWITLQGTTIGEMANEFNRRHKVQVRIDDASLAARRIDFARIKVTSVESFEDVLKSQPNMRVTNNGSVITLTQQHRSE